MPPVRTTRRSARQEELLGLLVDLFLAEGFAQFHVEELALRLRASKSTLYALGASKEQLIATVVRRFFRQATAEVEAGVERESDPLRRITAYLEGIAVALAPASEQFYEDLANLAPTRDIYAMNTRMAGRRVRELVRQAERPGRPVDSAFLGAATAVVMESIQQGRLRELGAAGSDADAYRSLADLLVAALR